MPKISGYSTPQPLAKGSSTGAVAPEKGAQPDQAAAAPSAASGDHLTLTDSARALQKLSDAVAGSPVVDSAKVSSVKQALANGSYHIDASSIANKILQFERGLK